MMHWEDMHALSDLVRAYQEVRGDFTSDCMTEGELSRCRVHKRPGPFLHAVVPEAEKVVAVASMEEVRAGAPLGTGWVVREEGDEEEEEKNETEQAQQSSSSW